MVAKSFRNMTQIQTHLIKRGFVAGYECWTNHGERIIETGEHSPVGDQCHGNEDTVMDDYIVQNTTRFRSPVRPREVQESDDTSLGDKPAHESERDRISHMLRDFEEDYKDDEKLYQKYLGMIDD